MLAVFAAILFWILYVYQFIIWIRIVLDLIRMLKPDLSIKGIWAALAEIVYVVTDPPLKLFRKLIPPVQIGNVRVDLFSVFLTLIVVSVLMNMVSLIR